MFTQCYLRRQESTRSARPGRRIHKELHTRRQKYSSNLSMPLDAESPTRRHHNREADVHRSPHGLSLSLPHTDMIL